MTEGGQWRRKKGEIRPIEARKFCYPGKLRYISFRFSIPFKYEHNLNSYQSSPYVFDENSIFVSFQLLLSKLPTRKSVKKLVEVIEEDDTKELVDTIERTGKVILEERNIDDDPPVDSRKDPNDYEIFATSTSNEITTPSCCKSEKRRDDGKLEHEYV